jgi:hypothetical protein
LWLGSLIGGLSVAFRQDRLGVFVSFAGSDERWREPRLVCGKVRPGVQPLAAGSAASFLNAVVSAVVDGHAVGRWSFARRPENAGRPAVCSSW